MTPDDALRETQEEMDKAINECIDRHDPDYADDARRRRDAAVRWAAIQMVAEKYGFGHGRVSLEAVLARKAYEELKK